MIVWPQEVSHGLVTAIAFYRITRREKAQFPGGMKQHRDAEQEHISMNCVKQQQGGTAGDPRVAEEPKRGTAWPRANEVVICYDSSAHRRSSHRAASDLSHQLLGVAHHYSNSSLTPALLGVTCNRPNVFVEAALKWFLQSNLPQMNGDHNPNTWDPPGAASATYQVYGS